MESIARGGGSDGNGNGGDEWEHIQFNSETGELEGVTSTQAAATRTAAAANGSAPSFSDQPGARPRTIMTKIAKDGFFGDGHN